MCRLVKDAVANGKGLVQVLRAATSFATTVVLLLKPDIKDTATEDPPELHSHRAVYHALHETDSIAKPEAPPSDVV